MATKFIQTQIHVFPPKPTPIKIPKLHPTITYSPHSSFSFHIKSADSDQPLLATAQEPLQDYYTTLPEIKQHLFSKLQGINRGIFGIPSEKKAEIEKLVEILESQNPTPDPTLCLEKVGGEWKLVYSTITILGSKRTKLGLRDFITLGDFIQSINVAQGKAVNVIKFSAKGLNLLNGKLTIEASFKIASKTVKYIHTVFSHILHSLLQPCNEASEEFLSPQRVDISYCKSEITPEQLMNVFRKNYDLLLGIFNPEGWLEITYVDECLRIGRDCKGNIFILERVEEDNH